TVIFSGMMLSLISSTGGTSFQQKLNKKLIGLGLVIPVVCGVTFYIAHSGDFHKLYLRLVNTDIAYALADRGYTQLIEYPKYLLFGAGQGLDSRFGDSAEIHSTWAGFLFYYGLIGLGLFLFFIFRVLREISW